MLWVRLPRAGYKPKAYEFLAELGDSCVDEISIEAAQPDLDLGVLEELGGKTIALGVLDLSTPEVESIETVAARIRSGLAHCTRRSPRARPGLWNEVHVA